MRNRRIRSSKDRRTTYTAEEIAELEAQPEVELSPEDEARLDEGWEADMEDIARQILEEMEESK